MARRPSTLHTPLLCPATSAAAEVALPAPDTSSTLCALNLMHAFWWKVEAVEDALRGRCRLSNGRSALEAIWRSHRVPKVSGSVQWRREAHAGLDSAPAPFVEELQDRVFLAVVVVCGCLCILTCESNQLPQSIVSSESLLDGQTTAPQLIEGLRRVVVRDHEQVDVRAGVEVRDVHLHVDVCAEPRQTKRRPGLFSSDANLRKVKRCESTFRARLAEPWPACRRGRTRCDTTKFMARTRSLAHSRVSGLFIWTNPRRDRRQHNADPLHFATKLRAEAQGGHRIHRQAQVALRVAEQLAQRRIRAEETSDVGGRLPPQRLVHLGGEQRQHLVIQQLQLQLQRHQVVCRPPRHGHIVQSPPRAQHDLQVARDDALDRVRLGAQHPRVSVAQQRPDESHETAHPIRSHIQAKNRLSGVCKHEKLLVWVGWDGGF
eukprot:scaffold1428_cov259-Pinguiococcus_pyrenoidosus.AAC.15